MSGNILIIGAAGQIGGALASELGKERVVGTYFRLSLGGGIEFDLEEAARTPRLADDLVERVAPAAIVICAGFTHVDGCEDDPDKAGRINRDGPAALARAGNRVGAKTVYFSTEYVFDGTSGPYDEEAHARPLSVYGKSKWEGERAVREADPEALILRTTVVYGPEILGKNFAYQLAGKLVQGERIRVPDDQVSTPSYNRDVAQATAMLLDVNAHGVFNVVGPEAMDRAVFAGRVARAAGLDPEWIEPIATASLSQRAKRPLGCGLTIGKLRQRLPFWRPRTVEEAVQHWLDNPGGKAWPR